MTKIRVTKEFSFEMAHALSRYDGKCENVHGHTYYLSITVCGSPEKDANSVKCGMVMDFSELKTLVHDQILADLDHALVLNETDRRCDILSQVSTKVVVVPYQPTCENLILEIVQRLLPYMAGSVRLVSVRLRETAQSYAEWFDCDNPGQV